MTIRLALSVVSESAEYNQLSAKLCLEKAELPKGWVLNFAFDYYINPKSVTNGTIQQIGSYCTFTPDSSERQDHEASLTFDFQITSRKFRYHSQGFSEAVIVSDNQHYAVEVLPVELLSRYPEENDIEQVKEARLALIPKPENCTFSPGKFRLNQPFSVVSDTPLAIDAIHWFMEETANKPVTSVSDYEIVRDGTAHNKYAQVRYLLTPSLKQDSYELEISDSAITLKAAEHQGFIHATATLLQLLEQAENELPVLLIKDAPRYHYRGFMLDCARHFYEKDQIKSLINQLAYLKINYFHWHLTDDEGWRIEIDAFPELTKTGAWRGPDEALKPQYSHLTSRYGGYYSKQDIREVIRFAQSRGITIIPEIDIPGHCRAAILSLPELLADPDDTSEYLSVQNYTDNVLNPALEGTYLFLDRVLQEVSALFPAPFIHIGGDEVPDNVWSECPRCSALMAELRYEKPAQLQQHLLGYVEQKLEQLGKQLIGWNEVHNDNKVSKNALISCWQSEEIAVECAEKGFDVILQPAHYFYLDMAQGHDPHEPGTDWACPVSLEKVYHYEPFNQLGSDSPLHKKISGVQCAIWTEHSPEMCDVQYMLFPRILAFAETAWCSRNERDWPEFLGRVKGQLSRLDRLGINYRNP